MLEEIHEREKLSLNEYIAIFTKYKFIIAGIAGVIVLISMIFSFMEKPVYVAKTVIMLEKVNTGSTFFQVTDPIGMLAMMNNQIQIIKSRKLFVRVNEAFKEDTILKRMGYEKVSASRNRVSVFSIQDTYIIEISYKDNDPFLASYIANKIADEYYKMNLEVQKSTVSQVRVFLEEQLVKIEGELNRAEMLLRDYKKTSKISTLERETEILIQQMSEFEADYNKVLMEIETNNKKKEFLTMTLNETQKNLVDDISKYKSTVMEQILTEITKTESMKSTYISQGYSKDHPKILEMESRISQLKDQLREESAKTYQDRLVSADPVKYSNQLVESLIEINTGNAFLNAQKAGLQSVLDSYNRQIEKLPDQAIQLARLERNAKVNEEIYLMLKRRYEEAKLQEVAEVGNIRIVDEATKPNPKNPVSPKKERNLVLGLITGVLLGVTVAFLLFFLDESVKTTEEVEVYTGEQILGIITFIGNTHGKRGKQQKKVSEDEMIEKMRSKLITNMEPHAPIAEAYRSIRTQLKYRSKEGERLVYVMTSSIPGEGKSTTLTNLAITVANLGKKVVLIDADMRKPVIHKIFNVRNGIGLAHYINRKATFEEIIRVTDVENLDVITYGTRPINPSELLESDVMKELLEVCKAKYDYTFMDAPPVNVVTDPIVLANYADKILWVVSPGRSKRKDLRHAKKLLIPVKRKIQGVIVNNAKTDVASYYSVYYKKYYGEGV